MNSLTKDQCGSGTKLSFLNHVELLPDSAILPVSGSYSTSERLYMLPGGRNIDTKVDVDAAHAPQQSRGSGPSPLPFTVVKCDMASQHVSETTHSLGQNNFIDIVSVNSHDAIIQHNHDLHVLYANPSALNAKPRDFGATSVATLDGYTAVLYSDGSVRLYNLTFHPIKWPVGMNGNLGWETDKVIPDNRCGLRNNVIQLVETPGSLLAVRDDGNIVVVYTRSVRIQYGHHMYEVSGGRLVLSLDTATTFLTRRNRLQLSGIKRVIANKGKGCGSICIVQNDNTVKMWGEILDIEVTIPPILGITPIVPMVPGSIVATDHAFAGVMVGPDKTALAWGHKDYGG